MALAEGQAHLFSDRRDLLMGNGTLYDLQDDFNPFLRQVRAPATGPRAWAHGSYTGAEWQSEVVVPVRVIANGASKDVASTRASIQQMSAGFAAVGATGEIVELRFRLDEDPDEFVMFGTPRGAEPDMSTLAYGYSYVGAAFVAQDPRIYSAVEQTIKTGLPLQQGALTVPLTAPVTVAGKTAGGRVTLTNTGTAPAPVTFRIDGPVPEPRIVLTGPDGIQQVVDFDLTLQEGQWLDIDSTKRTAFLNGLNNSNQRGRAEWTMREYPLDPGSTTLRFFAADYEADAELTVTFRSAHW